MAFPTNLGTGRVIGQFIAGVIDDGDPDQEPNYIPAQGTIELLPSVTYFPNVTAAGGPVTVFPAPITIVLDAEGIASTPEPGDLKTIMYQGVRVFANDDPDTSVQNWTWGVSYNLTAGGMRLNIPAHSITVLEGATVDLTTVVKVPSSPGVGAPQYEAAVLRAEAAAVAAAESAANSTSGGDGTGTGATDYTQLSNLPDLTVYALKTELHAAPDLTPYAKTEDLPETPDLTPYALKTELHAAPDLTPYAKTAELPAPPDLTSYALKTELHAPVDISGKADKTDTRFTDARTPTAHSHAITEVTGLTTALEGKQPTGDYATKTELADKGTSNLTLGTTAGTAKAGNYAPTYVDLPVGSTITVPSTSARPTDRTDIVVQFAGGTTRPAEALVGDIHLADMG